MPPPPPEPPPLPRGGGFMNVHGKSANNNPPADRNALLSQIRKGARLKKAETNDRSTPLIEATRSSSNTAKANLDFRPNGPAHVIPPGGLFAQGIPKLRPTFPRSGDAPNCAPGLPQSPRSCNTSLDHLRVGQVSGSRSQPPSPVSKPRQATVTRSIGNSENSSNPNFPDDVNMKGPAPPPPPANQKPNFKAMDSGEETQRDAAAKRFAVRRSASQTNLGQRPRLTRPPPNVKPPPPPKGNSLPQGVPPPPPSKPPNILRRQSFGIGETHSSRFAAAKLTVATSSTPKPMHKTIGPPPPPPRNNSAPNDLNQMVNNSSGVHLSKMNIAPPPPPPNRTVVLGNRAPMRPPPPRAPAPPPPLHRQPGHPAPPSQMKAVPPQLSAPPPPARISSIKQVTSDFEERFFPMFCVAQNLPKPERFSNCEKQYPSIANRLRQRPSQRRQPPPPPPPSLANSISKGNQGRPPLHIQLESCAFPNNIAHC